MKRPRGGSTRPRQRRVAGSAQTQQVSGGAVSARVSTALWAFIAGDRSWCV